MSATTVTEVEQVRETIQQRSRVNPFAFLMSVVTCAVGTPSFSYLALARVPASPDNPNPEQMDPFSQWVSIGFHGLLYLHIGDAIWRWICSCIQKRESNSLVQAYHSLSQDHGVKNVFFQLGKVGLFFIRAYLASLFALMPAISVCRAAQFADTPNFFVKSLMTIQTIFLWIEVHKFAGKLCNFCDEMIVPYWGNLEEKATLSQATMRDRLRSAVERLSYNRIEDRIQLLQWIFGGLYSNTSVPGLIQSAATDLRDWSFPKVKGSLAFAFAQENSRHRSWNAVQAAIEEIDQHLARESRCQVIASRVAQIILNGTAFIFCLEYVIPQISLVQDAMQNTLPSSLVFYMNPFNLDAASVSGIFLAGLACFFFNFIRDFLSGPMATHSRMILADVQALRWSKFSWRSCVNALCKQHLLIMGSLIVGFNAIPPFAYIFSQGLKAISMLDLKGLAAEMYRFLQWMTPLHRTVIYCVGGFLVASTCHFLLKEFVDWIDFRYQRDPPFGNLKSLTLTWIDELSKKNSEECRQEPDSGLRLALVYFAGLENQEMRENLESFSFRRCDIYGEDVFEGPA